jgi:hypothetical protein
MVKQIKKLFVEEEFTNKNAEREIIARLYFSDYCDLEDIEEMTGLMVHVEAHPESEDVFEMIRRENEGPAITKIEYKTEEYVKTEAKLAKKRRETGILLELLYKFCPYLKGRTLKQLAFIHSALDKISKLRNVCWGKKRSLETTEADNELFIEEGFEGANAEREIMTRLYSGGECELGDIKSVTNHTTPIVLSCDQKITYSTVGHTRFEINYAKQGRQTNILMNLIERCYPGLKGWTLEQLSFIHSVFDRIIKLNKSCQGDDWRLETAQEL